MKEMGRRSLVLPEKRMASEDNKSLVKILDTQGILLLLHHL